MAEIKRVAFPPPNLVWYPSRVVDGIQLWASLNWAPGEKAEYSRVVLRRNDE
jgi:hypothetical protein